MSCIPAPVRRERAAEHARAARRARATRSLHRVTITDVDRDDTGAVVHEYVGIVCESGRHAPCHAVFDCDCESLSGYRIREDGRPVHTGWDDEDDEVEHVGHWGTYWCSLDDWATMCGSLDDWAYYCRAHGIPVRTEVRADWDYDDCTFVPIPARRQVLRHRKGRKLVRA